MFLIQKINVLELVKPIFWIFLFLQTNDHHLSCHGTLVNLSQNNHTQVGKYKIIFSSHWPILLFIIQLISIEFTSIKMESQIRKVMCIGCSCLFPISSILKHLSKLQTCRNQYTEEDFAKLKQLCEAEAKRKISIKKATGYKLNQENKESLSVESENPSLTSLNPKYKCKGCSKILSVNSIMTHIVNKPDCLNQYSQNDLDEQKKQCKDHQNNKRRNKRISSNKETYERSKKRRNLEKKNQSDGKESEQKQISKESLVNEDDCEEVELPLEFVTDMLNDDSDGNIDNSEEDVEDFKCRGCKKLFKSNTILKHLKSPKVLCISEYHSYEIEELEDMSKLRISIPTPSANRKPNIKVSSNISPDDVTSQFIMHPSFTH